MLPPVRPRLRPARSPSPWLATVAGTLLAVTAAAQTPMPSFSITNSLPGSFTDISATGSSLATGDDVSVAFTSSVDNLLVTNRNLFVSTNGIISDVFLTGFSNTTLPSSAVSFGLFALWDDLYVDGPASLRHQAVIENGIPVEIVQWDQVRLYANSGASGRGTFQLKIFGAGPVFAQFLYQDVAFASGGSTATIGVEWGGSNAVQYSINTANSVAAGTVLSITAADGLFAGFGASPRVGSTPLNVQFHEASYSSAPGGITSYQWDFDGDAVTDSTAPDPTHVYTVPGTYTVSLTVTDAVHGSRTHTVAGYVTVVGPAASELEPNENKAQALANGPFVMRPGDSLLGSTQGSNGVTPGPTSADTWLVQTTPLPPGIYRHRLIPTSPTLLHGVTIRAASVTSATTDLQLQTAVATSTPPRFVQWYGFGRGERVYVRVTGSTATTSYYLLTLESTPVAPQVVPSGIAAGNLTISARGYSTLNNKVMVFDSQLQEMRDWTNDDPYGLSGSQFHLQRPFAPGVYYLAVAQSTLAGTYPEASQLAGSTTHFYPGSLGGESTPSATVMDFADVVCTNAAGSTVANSFAITDGVPSTTVVTAGPSQRATIDWYRIEVGPPSCPNGGFPVVVASPPSLTVGVGTSVDLTVGATGAAPLSYQWWFNGVPVPALVGGTNATLSLTNITPGHAGSYVCQVSNGCGFANSQPAILTVQFVGSPVITQQPVAATAHCLGEQVTFTVVASPLLNGALSYQWFHDGQPIAGAQASVLQFPLSGAADAGQYLCRVSEAGLGSTDSSPAELAVSNTPPVVTLLGDSHMQIECHTGSYVEAGAAVSDDCDTNLAAVASGTVDTHHVGTYHVTYTATDSWGHQVQAVRVVEVVDTTPPSVVLGVAKGVLTHQHYLTDVGLTATITDACSDPAFTFPNTWVEVWSNEDELSDTGDGSGAHSPDAANVQSTPGTPAVGTLRLRGERRGSGDGRVYVVVVYTHDEHGNLGFGVTTVVIPHDRSRDALQQIQGTAAAVVADLSGADTHVDVQDVMTARGLQRTGLEPAMGPHQ